MQGGGTSVPTDLPKIHPRFSASKRGKQSSLLNTLPYFHPAPAHFQPGLGVGGRKMKSKLPMQPFRLKGWGCLCDALQITATVMVTQAHDFLNRKELISQTFYRINISWFQNNQFKQESNPLPPQVGAFGHTDLPET